MTVDTRPKDGDEEGQHGVAITDSTGVIGLFRYLLLDIARTEERDNFGNTFFSEIDVVDADGPAPTTLVEKPILKSFETEDGKYRFTVDATLAPDLVEWSEKKLKPEVVEWYPKIVAMLPGEGYEAPQEITSLKFRDDMRGTPASAGGAVVNLNVSWFRQQLEGEARRAGSHELVHVVQSYRGRRAAPRAAVTPGCASRALPTTSAGSTTNPSPKALKSRKETLPEQTTTPAIASPATSWTGSRERTTKTSCQAQCRRREGRYEERFGTIGRARPCKNSATSGKSSTSDA